MANKKVFLRAFDILHINPKITEPTKVLAPLISDFLTDKTVKDRINYLDKNESEVADVLSYYESSENSIFGVITRLKLNGDVIQLEDELLRKKTFELDDLVLLPFVICFKSRI